MKPACLLRRLRLLPAWLLVGLPAFSGTVLQLGSAHAQNTAASESLFQRGVASLLAGDYASACPAIEESYALDPKAGTKFTLAECEAKRGRIATAAAHYSDYLGMVATMPADQRHRHADRASLAKKQVEVLRPRVPTLTIHLPSHAPPGTVVLRDGVALSRVSLGSPIPIDPGKHAIVTQAPNGTRRETFVEVATGENKSVVLAIERTTAVAQLENSTALPPEQAPEPRGAKGSRTWAYVTGGVGMTGITLGVVTGVLALEKKQTTDENCVASSCNAKGLDAAQSGRSLATASTVSFGVGVAGIIAGVALWFATPQAQSAMGRRSWTPIVAGDGRSTATLGLRGTW